MHVDKTIEEIIETYELPERLTKKIVGIARRQIEERDIYSFDSIYGRIAELVEKFQVPFKEARALRLDSRITHGSESTYHDVIGIDDPNLSRRFEYENNREVLSATEVLNILRDKIDPLDFDLLKQLVESNKRIMLHMSSEELLSSVGEIRDRLEELAQEYVINGRVVIPRRPIKYVFFNPLSIRFGLRNYNNGNPLEYLGENKKTYEGMNKRELFRFDPGFHRALRRHKQLDGAFPEPPRFYRGYNSPLECYRANEERYKGLGRRGLYDYDQGMYAALKRWNQLEDAIPEIIVGRGHVLSQQRIDKLISIHPSCRGNMSEAKRKTGHSLETIKKYWKVAGLNPRKPGRLHNSFIS